MFPSRKHYRIPGLVNMVKVVRRASIGPGNRSQKNPDEPPKLLENLENKLSLSVFTYCDYGIAERYNLYFVSLFTCNMYVDF